MKLETPKPSPTPIFRRLSALSVFPAIVAIMGYTLHEAKGAERPNILWLTFEDTSAEMLGCYVNPHATTPVIDKLAAEGIRFDRASSVAPHCSPARSTIISGVHATTWGTDLHRADRPVPEDRFYFPERLREAGYFTTNNSKTDYNTTTSHQELRRAWDELNGRASYLSPKRAEGQPFFAVFNTMISHMGRIASQHLEGRRNFSKEGLDPAKLKLPPYLPDTPEIRSDYAFMLEGVNDVDRWVGLHMETLKKHDLLEDTIVFVYSDHGGCLPRGKGYPFISGLRPAMVVWIPEKWRHLSRLPVNKPRDRLVGFEDLAPTVLKLAGAEVPAHYVGVDMLGEKDKPLQFDFRTNHGASYDPVRTVTDGRYQFIRYFIPHRPIGLWQAYQIDCPGHLSLYRTAAKAGEAEPFHDFHQPKPSVALYDLETDPWQRNNIAADPAQAQRVAEMSRILDKQIADSVDLGFFPPDERPNEGDVPLITQVREGGYPIAELHRLARLCSEADPSSTDAFLTALTSERGEFRYWGAAGLATLAQRGKLEGRTDVKRALRKAFKDERQRVAIEAACGLAYLGRGEAALQLFFRGLRGKKCECFQATGFESAIPYLTKHRKEIEETLGDNPAATPALLRVGWKSFDDYIANTKKDDKGRAVNLDRRKLIPLAE